MTMFEACSNKEQSKHIKDKQTEQRNNQEGQETDYIPTEVMSPKETNELTDGQFISAEDLTKIPDALTLEERALAFIYCYQFSSSDLNIKSWSPFAYGEPVPANEMHIEQKSKDREYFAEIINL